MRKFLCIVLLAAFMAPACVRKKTKSVKPNQKARVVESDFNKGPAYDEEVGAFILEDDAEKDVFSQEKSAAKQGAAPVEKQIREDLDDTWAWQELDEEQSTEVIRFNYDSAAVRPDQASAIRYDAHLAQEACKDGATVVIEGHSCLITRSQQYNQALSQKRANVVRERLMSMGVPAACMKAVGRGTSQLVTHAEGKEGQAPNRRVEIKFIYPRAGEKVAKKKKSQPEKTVKARVRAIKTKRQYKKNIAAKKTAVAK